MLTLGRHGQEGVHERGKTKTETEIRGDAEALLKNFLSDHQLSGIFEISVRRVDGKSPLQVKFCDASKSAFKNRHAEEEVSQGSPEEDMEDINDNKLEDSAGF